MFALDLAEYDLDDEELSSNGSSATINASTHVPLLVGVLSNSLRRSQDSDVAGGNGIMPNGGRRGHRDVGEEEDDRPEWLKTGGGMLSGIANMSVATFISKLSATYS